MHYDKGLFGKPSLDSFLLFLDSQHIPHAPGKGEYQLAQIWLNNTWLAITVDGKGLISTPVELRPLIEQFKNPVAALQQAQARVETDPSDAQRLDYLVGLLASWPAQLQIVPVNSNGPIWSYLASDPITLRQSLDQLMDDYPLEHTP